MNELISNRMMLTFEGMIIGGILLTHLFSFFSLRSVSGALVGAIIGGLLGYMIGRKIDLKEEKQ